MPQSLPIQELIEKAHATGLSANILQKLQRRANDSTSTAFPSSLTHAAAAAAAAAAAVQAATVQAATNTTEFLSHLHKQAEFDLIAKNHLDLYAENLLNANDARRINNDKLRNVNYNNNNNDTTLNDANKLSGAHKLTNIKSEGPKNSRSIDGSRMQKLFQVSKLIWNHFNKNVWRLLHNETKTAHLTLSFGRLVKLTSDLAMQANSECIIECAASLFGFVIFCFVFSFFWFWIETETKKEAEK